jgi:hypothetical protein
MYPGGKSITYPSSASAVIKMSMDNFHSLYGVGLTKADVEITSSDNHINMVINDKNENNIKEYNLYKKTKSPVVIVHYKHKDIPRKKTIILNSDKKYEMERDEARSFWDALQQQGWRE